MSKQIPRSKVVTTKSKIYSNKTLEDRVLKSYSEIEIRVGDDEEYKLESEWKDLIDSTNLTDTQRQQQFHIFEFIKTEKNYINRIRAVSQVVRQLFLLLQSVGDLLEYSGEEIFGNITDVFLVNDYTWMTAIKKSINKARETKQMIKPSDVFGGFVETDVKFKPYVKFCLQQDELLERIRNIADNSKQHVDFVTYMKFCEGLPCSSGRRLAELMVEPMKRITQYPIILKEVRKRTEDVTEQEFLDLIIRKFEGFVTDINTQLRKKSENQKLQSFLSEMDDQDVWLAGDEEVISTATEYLRLPINLKARTEQRCLLERGLMRIVTEGRKKVDVNAILFSDVLIMARQRKTNRKLTLVKQMYFLDKLILKKSEISSNCVILVYKNEIGLLSDALKLEIVGGIGRDSWFDKVEQAKAIYISVRSNNGTTLDFFKERYNPVDYNKRKDFENESLNSLRRTSSWLLTKESVEAIRKNQGKERSSSADSFRRALSESNSSEGLEGLSDISEEISLNEIEDETNVEESRDICPSFSQLSTEERQIDNAAGSTELSLTHRVSENEITVQTEITFNNGYYKRYFQQKFNRLSFTTKF